MIVYSVAFSDNSQMLASGSGDKTIKLWNTHTNTEIFTLTGHLKSVNSVAFSPGSNMLASGSDDQTVNLWNVRSMTKITTF
jgi:WD40 repeat protein